MSDFRCVLLLIMGVCFSLVPSVGARGEQRSYALEGATRLDPRLREVTCEGGTLEFTEAGLRVVVDSSATSGASCGLALQVPLGGDFECTLRYALEDVQPPATGIGSGVKIFAKTVGPKEMALTFAHLLGSDGKAFYLVMLRPNDGKNNRFEKFDAGDVNSGALRISRVGNDLFYSVAAGDPSDHGEFRELFKTFVEPQAVAGVRLVNSVSGAAKSSILLHDAKLVADRFDRNYTKRARGGSTSTFWFIAAVIMIVGGAYVFYLLRRKGADTSEPANGGNDD